MKNIWLMLLLFNLFSWSARSADMAYNCSWGHDYDMYFRFTNNTDQQYFRFIEGGHLIELWHNNLEISLEPTHVTVQGMLVDDSHYKSFIVRFLRAKYGDKIRVIIEFISLDGATLDPFDFECTITHDVNEL